MIDVRIILNTKLASIVITIDTNENAIYKSPTQFVRSNTVFDNKSLNRYILLA